VLQSAIANAENNHDLDVDDLVVREASVGKGLVMKRFHARARGHAGRVEKFFSHITIVVEEKREEEVAKKANQKMAKKDDVTESKSDNKGAKTARKPAQRKGKTTTSRAKTKEKA
jgi:large subunit ribosomal protein L22